MNLKQRLWQWLPAALMVAATAAVCIIYYVSFAEPEIAVVLQTLASATATLCLPVYAEITKKPFPAFVNILLCVHIFLSSALGSALDFYEIFPWWDLLMHGFFGFVCSVVVFCLLLAGGGRRLHPVLFFTVICAFTLGVAAVWEMIEYAYDTLFGGNAQRVQDWVPGGPSPVADTMEDMIVSIAGIVAFYLFILADKFLNYRFCRGVYLQLKPKGE